MDNAFGFSEGMMLFSASAARLNIVTANGPAAAKKFGNEIVRLLQEKQG